MNGFKRTHPVQPPKLNIPSESNSDHYFAKFYQIEPVTAEFVCDDEKHPRIILDEPSSATLLESMSQANLKRWTCVSLSIKGQEVPPQCLARLNWFLHIPGYTKGFRAWKRSNKDRDGGTVLWKSNHSWDELKQVIGLGP